jgi:hypothetical protein
MMLIKGNEVWGGGAVDRDVNGKFLIASCKEIHFVADSFMAEEYALREGLRLAQHLGGNRFIVQSDNIQIIKTMFDGGFTTTLSAVIFDDCRLVAMGLGRSSVSIVIDMLMRVFMCLVDIVSLITSIVFGTMIPLVFCTS